MAAKKKKKRSNPPPKTKMASPGAEKASEESDESEGAKLPKIKISPGAATGSGQKQIPKMGVTSAPKSETSRIDLDEEAADTTMAIDLPDDVEESTKQIEPIDDATIAAAIASESNEGVDQTSKIDLSAADQADMGTTMKVEIEQASAPVSDEGISQSDDTLEMKSESRAIPGIAATPKGETTRIKLSETQQASVPSETDAEVFNATTMPMGDIPDEDDEEGLDSTQSVNIPGQAQDVGSQTQEVQAGTTQEVGGQTQEVQASTTQEVGGQTQEVISGITQEVPGQTQEVSAPTDEVDDEIFKSTTMPMEPIPAQTEEAATSDSGEIHAEESDGDIFKSTTIAMPTISDELEAEETEKSSTVSLDAPAPKQATPKAPKPARKQTMKISKASVQQSAAAQPAAPSPKRPTTIKLKKPGAVDIKTVKLQKGPEEGSEAAPPAAGARQKTVKLKRATPGGTGAKPVSVARGGDGPTELVLGPSAGSVEETESIGAIWSIVAILALGAAGTATWFLYQAFTLYQN